MCSHYFLDHPRRQRHVFSGATQTIPSSFLIVFLSPQSFRQASVYVCPTLPGYAEALDHT